jgi:hypothetical protein
MCVFAVSLALAAQPAVDEVRRERVMQLAAKADAKSCELLESALTDPSSDIRGRAASALYWKCDRGVTGQRAVQSLCRSVAMGNANAGALLLLGYAVKPEEAIPCLDRTFPKWARVKLVTSTKPVAAAVAARVSLARLGSAKATGELRAAFSSSTALPETLFLLAVLGDIRDPGVLSAALVHLGDARECPGLVAHATRQVRDVALEAFASRHKLELRACKPLSPRKCAFQFVGISFGRRQDGCRVPASFPGAGNGLRCKPAISNGSKRA